LGIGDWGLGIGGLGIGPNPQSPIPNPHCKLKLIKLNLYYIKYSKKFSCKKYILFINKIFIIH